MYLELFSFQWPSRNTNYDSTNLCNYLTEIALWSHLIKKNRDSEGLGMCLRSSKYKGQGQEDKTPSLIPGPEPLPVQWTLQVGLLTVQIWRSLSISLSVTQIGCFFYKRASAPNAPEIFAGPNFFCLKSQIHHIWQVQKSKSTRVIAERENEK